MSHDTSVVVGGIMVAAFILALILASIFVLTKVAPKMNAKKRKQKIETAMRMGMFDREAIDEVAAKLREERWGGGRE